MTMLITSYVFAIAVTTIAAVFLRRKFTTNVAINVESPISRLNDRIGNLEQGIAMLLEAEASRKSTKDTQGGERRRAKELISELSAPGLTGEKVSD